MLIKLPPPTIQVVTETHSRKIVYDMANWIKNDFSGKPLLLVYVLSGALRVTAQLIRRLDSCAVQDEPVRVTSYDGKTARTAVVYMLKLCEDMVRGKNVVIIDDIVDTGQTLTAVYSQLADWSPNRLKVGVFLTKRECQKSGFSVPVDFPGAHIDNHFVIGMGLDYRGFYRNLNHVAVLHDEGKAFVDHLLETGEPPPPGDRRRKP